jgi:putative two-component system response regulator
MNMDRKKILLIDDDEVQHVIAKNMLQDKYDVFKAKSGNDAFNYFKDSSTVQNLILLDILMPEMDGWEVFNRIKAVSLLKSVPIAFVTSLSDTTEEEKAFSIGAADFIKKPFVKDYLMDRIQKILN